jgi:DNA topoisomerase-1
MARTKTTARTKTPTRKTPAVAAARVKGRKTKAALAVQDGADDLDQQPAGSTSLVIVESPAKARTIGKYLGRGYRVKATVGHVRDLPEKKLGIDIEAGFKPQYETIPGKEKTIADLQSAAKDSKEILLATDPDREGEAIAWHLASQLKTRGGAPVRRVLFHEITKDAVRKAVEEAGQIDERKVEAQQARRVLDRLVGYKTSPVLWKTVKKGLSAGRVQTVALRLVVEREREIRAFTPVEYWTMEALLNSAGHEFTAKLHHIDGKKPEIPNEAAANKILADVSGRRTFPVTDIKRRERRKNPSAPFTTSTLQQEASKKCGFGSKRTMRLAQDLYEGIELGDEGAQGLITYMRTDSTRVSDTAAAQAREYLLTLFGANHVASAPQLYPGTGRHAQDAHEAVRPTDATRRPDEVKRYLTPDQFKLYQLIWQRFMASQMAPAIFDTTTVDFDLGRYLFRATGSVMKFAGFLALYRESREDGESKPLEDEQALPALEIKEEVPVTSITPVQHFTEPPPRYSEASLVKELERLGIGRPSTYASIVTTLVDRRYAVLEQRRFQPTELGDMVERVMIKQFPDIFNVRFTSEMEDELDRVEDGELSWQRVLTEFYGPFSAALGDVRPEELIAEAHDLSRFENERCPDCGGRLVPRGGFFGPFIACENHPKKCSHTRPLRGDKAKAVLTDQVCHECGEFMVIRQGPNGQFLGCSKFPKCRGTRSLPTGVKCPKCAGDIAQRRSKKRGKAFFGCMNYPKCDFVVWEKPVPEVCPDCAYEGAEAKFSKTRGDFRKCIKCGNEWELAPVEEHALAG